LFAFALLAERRGLTGRAEDSLSRLLEHLSARLDSHHPEGRERWLTAVALILLCLHVGLPLLTNRLPSGHDAGAYFPRLVEFHENITRGVVPPRWAPDLSNGYGQPLFVFAPPLVYYAGEVWHLLGLNVVASLNLAAFCLLLGAGFSMFLLGSYYFGRAGGLLAATAYVYAPYFHVNLYVRHALADFAAFAFLPLAFYGFARFAQGGELRQLSLGGLAYAGVLYCHHPAALLFSPILLVFLAFAAWRARSTRLLARGGGGILLGLGLAASSWLPFLLERQFVHLDRAIEGYLRYANHFVYPSQLLHSSWGYGLLEVGSRDAMSLSLGWSHVLLAILALLAARGTVSEDARAWQRFFAWAALGLCAFMVPGAAWLWEHLTLVQYVQFPCRLLGPAAVCLAVVIGALGCCGWRLALACVALLVVANAGHARPERYHEFDLGEWTPARLAQRGVAVTTREEYESRWVVERAPYRPEGVRLVAGDARVEALSRTPDHWRAQLHARAESVLEPVG
jgi:hypothetical protein